MPDKKQTNKQQLQTTTKKKPIGHYYHCM